MLVFGHRGFSGVYPENTMLSFRKAVEVGADGIELDVHLSKDGELMVIHDEKLLRTTGKEGEVADYTRSELEAIKASKTQDDRYEATIPSFEEYCAFASKEKIVTNVEIKTGIRWYKDIERKTVEMVYRFHLEDRIIFSSFNWLSVVRCKSVAPEIPCGLLFEQGGQDVRYLACQAKDHGIEFLHPDYRLVDKAMREECRENGIGLNVWTVNKEEQMKQLMEWGVRGAISNYPDMCLRLLGRA